MKKAIQASNNLVDHRKNFILEIQDITKPWNIVHKHIMSSVVDIFTYMMSNEIQYLEKVIKHMVNPTKCQHPKTFHDKCEDVWYYMKCNQDLKLT